MSDIRTDNVIGAVGAAGIQLPAAVTAALAVAVAIRAAQNEPLPERPLLPGVVTDAAAAIATYAAAVIAHEAEARAVQIRRQAAVDLEAVAATQVSMAVGAAVPELMVEVVERFTAEWAAAKSFPDMRRLATVDRLYEARLALGEYLHEATDPVSRALVVFNPGAAPNQGTADVLVHWGSTNMGPHYRWQRALPALEVAMVLPAEVPNRVATLRSRPAPTTRPSVRPGAAYDRPLPTGSAA